MLGPVLSALGVLFLLGFAAAVAHALREAGQGLAAGVVLAAATAFAAVQLVLSALFAALAYSVADAAVTLALFDFGLVLDVVAGLASGLFILAAAKGLKRIGAIPAWLAVAGTIIATLHFLRVTAWARDGFWSPSGSSVLLAVGTGLAWILVTSVVLVRRAPSPRRSAIAEHPQAAGG